jgi:hypothetical protein
LHEARTQVGFVKWEKVPGYTCSLPPQNVLFFKAIKNTPKENGNKFGQAGLFSKREREERRNETKNKDARAFPDQVATLLHLVKTLKSRIIAK